MRRFWFRDVPARTRRLTFYRRKTCPTRVIWLIVSAQMHTCSLHRNKNQLPLWGRSSEASEHQTSHGHQNHTDRGPGCHGNQFNSFPTTVTSLESESSNFLSPCSHKHLDINVSLLHFNISHIFSISSEDEAKSGDLDSPSTVAV